MVRRNVLKSVLVGIVFVFVVGSGIVALAKVGIVELAREKAIVIREIATGLSKEERAVKALVREAEKIEKEAKRLKSKHLYREAISKYEEVIKRFPQSKEALKARFRIPLITYLYLAEGEKALGIYEKMLKEFSNDKELCARIFYKMGDCYRNMKAKLPLEYKERKRELVKKAIEKYNTVLERYPKTEYADDALDALTSCYRYIDDHENELKCYQRMVDEYPESKYAPSAQREIASYYRSRDPKRAIEELWKIVEKWPDSHEAPYALMSIGGIYVDPLEQFDKALQMVDKILRRYPDYPDYKDAAETILIDGFNHCSYQSGKYGPLRPLANLEKEIYYTHKMWWFYEEAAKRLPHCRFVKNQRRNYELYKRWRKSMQ
jgi:outer membrane protein assembly factor BamD (BamD/ComL family)